MTKTLRPLVWSDLHIGKTILVKFGAEDDHDAELEEALVVGYGSIIREDAFVDNLPIPTNLAEEDGYVCFVQMETEHIPSGCDAIDQCNLADGRLYVYA